jgi:hypothetical protein
VPIYRGHLLKSNDRQPGIVRCACELADTGLYPNTTAIKKALQNHGYVNTIVALMGRGLAAELNGRIRLARGQSVAAKQKSKDIRRNAPASRYMRVYGPQV